MNNQKIALVNIRRRIDKCWAMAQTFLENKDAHGLHDIGVEIEALERSYKEVEKL